MTERRYESPPEDLMLRRAFELPRTRRNRLARWEKWKQEHWDPQEPPQHQPVAPQKQAHRGIDLRANDRAALDEITLYADVLTAVAASDRPLTVAELDAVLGVEQQAIARDSRQ